MVIGWSKVREIYLEDQVLTVHVAGILGHNVFKMIQGGVGIHQWENK